VIFETCSVRVVTLLKGFALGALVIGAFSCGGETSVRSAGVLDRGDANAEAGRDATSEAGRDGAPLYDAGDARDATRPLAPAVGCIAPAPGPLDAGAPGLDAGAAGCVDCQPVQRTLLDPGTGMPITETLPACCAEGPGTKTCGLTIDQTCRARAPAGTTAPACAGGCCREDGMCGALAPNVPDLGCIPDDTASVTCRAASGRHPGACACASCAAEIAACGASASCTAIVTCRSGRTVEEPADADGYHRADALDACLERAGCERLPELGVCREPCPSGSFGGGRIRTNLAGCCRADGLCGLEYREQCTLYDDPVFSAAIVIPTGPPPTCAAAAAPHPDSCACTSCKDALLECGRDVGCVAIAECRVEKGCSADACSAPAACGEVIASHDGASGPAATRDRSVESCLLNAGCAPRQFGLCR